MNYAMNILQVVYPFYLETDYKKYVKKMCCTHNPFFEQQY